MIIVDTGVLSALAYRRDAHHAACVRWFFAAPCPLVVPPLVVAEVCYLTGRHLSSVAEATFLDAFADGSLTLGELLPEDVVRMAALVRQYFDLRLGGTDAAVIATAERTGVTSIVTVDRRHFTVVRPRHIEAFTLRSQPARRDERDHRAGQGHRSRVVPGRHITGSR